MLGTGSQPVFCTGPFAADNVVVKSNEGDLYIVNSAMLIYLNASFGSEKGAVTLQQAIQVRPAAVPGVTDCMLRALPLHFLLLGRVAFPIPHPLLAPCVRYWCVPWQSSGNLTTIYSNAGKKIMLEAVFANSMTVRTTGGRRQQKQRWQRAHPHTVLSPSRTFYHHWCVCLVCGLV